MVSLVFGKCHKVLLVTLPWETQPEPAKPTSCSAQGMGTAGQRESHGGQAELEDSKEKCEGLSSLLVRLIRRGTRERAAQMLRLSLGEDNKLWHF